jgi:hypothetical protein
VSTSLAKSSIIGGGILNFKLEINLTESTWRFLLACFLLVALSFNGIAKASMIGCDQGHPGHEFLMKSAPDFVQTAADHTDHHHHVVSSEKSKIFKDNCNRCAPCCSGVAIPTELAIVMVASVVAQYFPALTVVAHSTDRGRLDRPPKNFLV